MPAADLPEAVLDVSLEQMRATRSSVKWAVAGPDVIPAWVAEMDARPVPAVVAAVCAAVERGDTGYPWARELVEAWREFSSHAWGFAPDAASTMLVADVMTGIHELIREYTDEGGPVIVTPPVYPSFIGFIDAAHRRRVDVPLGAGFRLDLPALEHAFAREARGRHRAMFLLCSPHNPTGTVHTREELEQVARLADEYGVTVVSDEIHAPLTHDGTDFHAYLSVAGSDRGFAVSSASKAWNLAGLKAGLVMAGPDVPRAPRVVGTLHEVLTHGASHLGVIAHTAALRGGRDWLERVRAELVERFALLDELLAAHLPDVGRAPARAGYLAWLDLRGTGLGPDPAAPLLAEGKVFASRGPDFGPGGEGHIRLNVATAPGTIEQVVDRLARVIRAAGGGARL